MDRTRLALCFLAALSIGVLALAGVGAFPGAASAPGGSATPTASDTGETAKRVQALREKLAQSVNLSQGIDPNTPLKDALEFLSQEQGVPIHIDRAAFKAEGLADPENHPVGLPKTEGQAFRLVLQRVLAEMTPPTSFLVQYDRLVIVPRSLTRPVDWTAELRHVVPTVDVEFDSRPLEKALREIGHLSGINVVLDAKIGEKAKTPLSVSLARTPVDTAVLLLADMADLTVLALDSVLYVTTREHAQVLQEELEQRGLSDRLTTRSAHFAAP